MLWPILLEMRAAVDKATGAGFALLLTLFVFLIVTWLVWWGVKISLLITYWIFIGWWFHPLFLRRVRIRYR